MIDRALGFADLGLTLVTSALSALGVGGRWLWAIALTVGVALFFAAGIIMKIGKKGENARRLDLNTGLPFSIGAGHLIGASVIGNAQGSAAAEIVGGSAAGLPAAEIEVLARQGQNATGLVIEQNGPGTGLQIVQNGPGTGLRIKVGG